MTLKRTYLLLFCLLLIAGAAHAQRITGAIQGEVTDEEKAPLPGVNVSLSGEALIGGTQINTTGVDGKYRFPGLPPGSYKLSFELQGFQTIVHDQVRIIVGSTV